MEMTLRWYGSKFDTVTLKQIRQIPGVTGVITTLYDTAPGEVWSRERIKEMKDEVEKSGLHVSGIESVNVHDAIKVGTSDRDKYIDNYIKTLERDLKLLSGTGDEDNRDIFVYNSLELILSNVTKVDSIYNLMRNYLTQKPFSEEKIKLNFNTPCLLAGWDINKESDYCGIMLLKDDNYYLGILASGCRNAFKNLKACESSEPYYEKMVLKQIPSSAKYLSSKQIYPQNPPEEIGDVWTLFFVDELCRVL